MHPSLNVMKSVSRSDSEAVISYLLPVLSFCCCSTFLHFIRSSWLELKCAGLDVA